MPSSRLTLTPYSSYWNPYCGFLILGEMGTSHQRGKTIIKILDHLLTQTTVTLLRESASCFLILIRSDPIILRQSENENENENARPLYNDAP